MEARTEFALHRLKGTLEGRLFILSDDLSRLKYLSDELESQFYKGHTRGRIEAMSAWQTDTARLLTEVSQIIEEYEHD